MNAPTACVDFETRSACSIRACGAWRYSVDSTTEILCLAYSLPFWDGGRTELWHPAFLHLGIQESPIPADLFEWITDGGLVCAHNVQFEEYIWSNIATPRFSWPVVPMSSWRCSAAKAAAHALPRALEDACTALKLSVSKDVVGHKAMVKASKPRKSRKAERELWAKTGQTPPTPLWHESRELFETIWAYCRQDVLAECALSDALPDLSPHETDVFLMDLAVNLRGFQLDPWAVAQALTLIEEETAILNSELAVITNGVVKKATQRAQMITWFNSQGVVMENTQKATLDAMMEFGDVGPGVEMTVPVQRALEIVRALGRSSTAKYQKMSDWADPRDWRVRGSILYHGASTGRFSGRGVQPHNFPRGSVKDMEKLWKTLQDAQRPTIEAEYGSVMAACADGLRGAIVACPRHVLYVADYAAIEARVVLWLADDQAGLDLFRSGADIYCSMADSIYGYSVNKATHPTERGVGKVAILGLGFQMGAPRFQAAVLTMAGIIIDDELAQATVNAYRERFWRVKALWADTQEAAMTAVSSKRPERCGYTTWVREGIFLYCVLPSGRRLAYAFPQIKATVTSWGETRPALTFMGVDPLTRQWKRQSTYGGSLVENVTQSVARDLMAEGMMRIEASADYELVLSVHDETVAESVQGTGSVQEYERLLTELPDWAAGCPIAAEGFTTFRYKK